MSDEKQLVIQESQDLSLVEYGKRADIIAFGKRILAMLPGAKEIGEANAMALAQYALSIDANPWRGEIYGWLDKDGKLILDEGYKLHIRWAERTSRFNIRYIRLQEGEEGIAKGDIGYRGQLLRSDKIPDLNSLIRAGMDTETALDFVCDTSVGIVKSSEMKSQKGWDIPAPKGWSWDERARTRCLKNTIKKGYGTPSPRDIARMSWEIDGIQTRPEDWTDITPEMSIPEREEVARRNALRRQNDVPPPENAIEAIAELFDGFVDGEVITETDGSPFDILMSKKTLGEITSIVVQIWPKEAPLSNRRLCENMATVFVRDDLAECTDPTKILSEAEGQIILKFYTELAKHTTDKMEFMSKRAELAVMVRQCIAEKKLWEDGMSVVQAELEEVSESTETPVEQKAD